MNYLEYINNNVEGLDLLDKLRKNIKEIIYRTIKEEFTTATESDVEKLFLIIECEFIDSVTSEESEWDIKEMTLKEVEFQIGTITGLLKLCKGLEKNCRESYSEVLYNVTYDAISYITDMDEACEWSNGINEFYLMNLGEYEGEYYIQSNKKLLEILSDIYKFLFKDKLNS